MRRSYPTAGVPRAIQADSPWGSKTAHARAGVPPPFEKGYMVNFFHTGWGREPLLFPEIHTVVGVPTMLLLAFIERGREKREGSLYSLL